MHSQFEPDSFVPLAQVHTEAVRGVKVPNWGQYRLPRFASPLRTRLDQQQRTTTKPTT